MIIHFDDSASKEALYPFTATRSAADIRIGILTIREKWERIISQDKSLQAYGDITIPAIIIPSKKSAAEIIRHCAHKNFRQPDTFRVLNHPWDIFKLNAQAIEEDYQLITAGRQSCLISATNKIINPENVFLEEGVKMGHCIINATSGPVYIGKDAELMEGCMVRGPFAICEGAVLKMGTKVYAATSIGPFCLAGGEIKNSVMFGYSNKAHDGYLGDSVIGEWCNLGAGTSNSNIRNTAGNVKVWDNAAKDYKSAGIKCGLLMGDYSRSAINTSFNTGTVAGVCCNIFSAGFPSKFIPDFSWGEERYIFEKALEDISNWKKLKGRSVTEKEIQTLKTIYYNQ